MSAVPIEQRIDAIAPLAAAICRAMAEELAKIGFAQGTLIISAPQTARWRLVRDPASGESGLVGEWRGPQGQRLGGLVFHADGTFFVEHDVVRPHPRDGRWFVEAVNAWGRDFDIRAEPRLLAALS